MYFVAFVKDLKQAPMLQSSPPQALPHSLVAGTGSDLDRCMELGVHHKSDTEAWQVAHKLLGLGDG